MINRADEIYRKPLPSEHNEQATLFEWLFRVALREEPLVDPLIFAVPNGARLGGNVNKQISNLKAEGFTPGVVDVICLIPRCGYGGFVLEMKKQGRESEKAKGIVTGGVTEGQREFLSAAEKAGLYTLVAYGADQAIDAFRWYLHIESEL